MTVELLWLSVVCSPFLFYCIHVHSHKFVFAFNTWQYIHLIAPLRPCIHVCHYLGFYLFGRTVRFSSEISKYMAPGGFHYAVDLNNSLWTANSKTGPGHQQSSIIIGSTNTPLFFFFLKETCKQCSPEQNHASWFVDWSKMKYATDRSQWYA